MKYDGYVLLNDYLDQLGTIVDKSRHNIGLCLILVGIFWAVHIINVCTRYRLNQFGIIPRRSEGFLGIIFSPFLHGNFQHLLFNSLPLFLLINLLMLYGQEMFIVVSLVVIVGGGFATWLFGRPAIHIGASGLLMGYFGFLLVQVYFNPGVLSVFVIVVTLYYLSGLFMSLIPGDKGVSVESHIFGFLAGLAIAYLLHLHPLLGLAKGTFQTNTF